MDRIVACRITPHDMFTMPRVMVKFDLAAEEEELFNFFADEISFTEEEFIGLTRAEALNLYAERDKAFITGP